MKIPRKINPDNLKDTLVEFRFSSAIPLDLLPGMASMELFKLGYQYIPLNNPNISFNQGKEESGFSLGINSDRSGFFVKDDVRIQFVKDVMVFNCIQDKYVGWENYSHIILTITQLFAEKGLVKSFNRAAIRYISVFENTDIFKNIKADVHVADLGFGLEDTVLRLSKSDGDTRVFLTLTNSAKKQDNKSKIEKQASIVDINVYHSFQSSVSHQEVSEVLEKIHTIEKETFFGLITADFLTALTPEY